MINRSLSTNILIETKIIKLNVCEIFNHNRLQTGSNPGSLPSSSCDIHQSQTCVRNSCSAFAPEPNKYRKRFQKNFIRKSCVLSVQEGMFACHSVCCERLKLHVHYRKSIGRFLKAWRAISNHLWSTLSAKHMYHFLLFTDNHNPLVFWNK